MPTTKKQARRRPSLWYELREWIPSGAKVYTLVRHSPGLSHRPYVEVLIGSGCDILPIGCEVAEALHRTYCWEHRGVVLSEGAEPNQARRDLVEGLAKLLYAHPHALCHVAL